MKKKYVVLSLICNVIIVLMVAFACYSMFSGFKFMHGHDLVLQSTKIGMFRFFTVDSNIFMGIMSLVFIIQDIQILSGKKKELTKKDYIWKLMATSGVFLTFFVVFTYLKNVSQYGLASLLMNSNLFFHLLVPLLAIITFVLFERNNKLSFKHSLYGIIPTFVYGLYYLTQILMHMKNGVVSPKYDFYYFVQNGVSTALYVIPIIFLISYILSLVLYAFNQKRKK